MMANRLVLAATVSLALAASVGCHPYYQVDQPPPPPSPAYQAEQPPPAPAYPMQAQAPPLLQLADRNGFGTGRNDGARDAAYGAPFSARRTRAYYETPGYDPQLGPFDAYQNAFRNAYLHGYEAGYYRH